VLPAGTTSRSLSKRKKETMKEGKRGKLLHLYWNIYNTIINPRVYWFASLIQWSVKSGVCDQNGWFATTPHCSEDRGFSFMPTYSFPTLQTSTPQTITHRQRNEEVISTYIVMIVFHLRTAFKCNAWQLSQEYLLMMSVMRPLCCLPSTAIFGVSQHRNTLLFSLNYYSRIFNKCARKR